MAKIACQTCHIPTAGGAVAKDFTRWTKDAATGWWEPTTINRGPGAVQPVLAWYNGQVRNKPHFIGPKGARRDGKSKITPFRVYEGRAYYDKKIGQAPLDGLRPADRHRRHPRRRRLRGEDARARGRRAGARLADDLLRQQPPGDEGEGAHLRQVPRRRAAAVDFEALGYTKAEIEKRKLRSAALWFDKLHAKEAKKEEW